MQCLRGSGSAVRERPCQGSPRAYVPSSCSSSQSGSKHRKLGQRENVCWAWLAGLGRRTAESIDRAKAKTDPLGVLTESPVMEGEPASRQALALRWGPLWGFIWLSDLCLETPQSLEVDFIIRVFQVRERGSEKLSNLHKVTQLRHDQAGV